VQAAAGIRLMAAGAVGIKNVAADGLGGIQSQFGIGLAALGLTSGDGGNRKKADQRNRRPGNNGKNRAHVERSWLESDTILIAMAILLKHTCDPAQAEDGARVLVDQKRPRGVAKDSLRLNGWLPVLAPSDALMQWFGESPARWRSFRGKYLAELCNEKAVEALNKLEAIAASEKQMTLLTSEEDQEHSHARILRDLLEGVKKPPATSGPARAAASGRIRARRPR